MRAFFKNDDFQYAIEIVLGACYRQGADAGEALATAGRIKDGDADAWVSEWSVTATRCLEQAQVCEAAGRQVSALAAYRRAATYFSTALYQFAGAHDHSDERELEIWRQQRACWDRIVDLLPVPGERLTIPYEGTTLPAYFFRAPDAAPGERRPLVVMVNGSDGATSAMWNEGGAAAGERGFHWMTFDGPGQQATLFEQRIPFRHDWEAVLTPVLDAMLARPDVDGERVAAIGISQAGYWVPRALAFERRLVAAVLDPGVTDVSASWTKQLPQVMRDQLRDGKKTAFDREMHLVERVSSGTAATLNFRGKPYGLSSDSRFDLYQEVFKYRLDGEEQQITTPVLLTDPEDEQFWPGQSQELYERLPGAKEIVSFTAAEGANRHCEPMGQSVREARIFDWLEGYLR